jgi:hypothetical protein
MNLDNSNTLSKNSAGKQTYGSNLNGKNQEKTGLASFTNIDMEDVQGYIEDAKGYASSAISFVKARPIAFLLGAVAIGGVVALVVSQRNKTTEL